MIDEIVLTKKHLAIVREFHGYDCTTSDLDVDSKLYNSEEFQDLVKWGAVIRLITLDDGRWQQAKTDKPGHYRLIHIQGWATE